MFTESQINEQVLAASKVIAKGIQKGLVAIVTESKLSATSRKSWLGFHFAKESEVELGNTEVLQDGTIRKNLFIVYG